MPAAARHLRPSSHSCPPLLYTCACASLPQALVDARLAELLSLVGTKPYLPATGHLGVTFRRQASCNLCRQLQLALPH